jgi:hypothetical protein
MAARDLPNLGLRAFYDLGQDGWKDDQDLGLLKLSVLVQPVVLSIEAAEPATPALGDVHLLDEAHATHANEIIVWDGETGEEAWVYITPHEGWKVFVLDEEEDYRFDGVAWESVAAAVGVPEAPEDGTGYVRKDGAWVAESGGGGGTVTESLIVAVGDETTAITTGAAKVTFRMPYAFTLTAVKASLTTASSSGNPTVDINEGGATILSTKLSIDSGEKTSATAATAAVISDSALADDAEITIDIDVAGTGAAGLKVYLIGHQ